MTGPRMAGTRVLVVEDEFLLAIALEDLLTDEGCIVIGPFARVSDALAAASGEKIDLAVLDVNVAGEKVFPVADVLDGRGVPFVLLTGYGDTAIPRDRRHWQAYSKPYRAGPLIDALVAKIAVAGRN
jgi:DNA-binding NtrC family response regulator